VDGWMGHRRAQVSIVQQLKPRLPVGCHHPQFQGPEETS
jgi:hypothetical protein